jgi:transcriptional regulator of acetoin/glycerol metabolism
MDACLEAIPKGWRLIVEVADVDEASELSDFECVQLPDLPERCDDLAEMIAAWIRQRRPVLSISPEVLDRLVRMARDGGLERVDRVLSIAIPAAVDRLDLEHLPVNGYAAELVDEILRDPDPFGALEMRLLREVLCRSDWRVQDAADRLGVSRTTLWRKMRDHGIERPGCANGGD